MALRLNLKGAKPVAGTPGIFKKIPEPLPTLIGIYKVKEGKVLEFHRYGKTWSFPEGFEVEVTYEKGTQVLVDFDSGLRLYVDTQLFLECCTR